VPSDNITERAKAMLNASQYGATVPITNPASPAGDETSSGERSVPEGPRVDRVGRNPCRMWQQHTGGNKYEFDICVDHGEQANGNLQYFVVKQLLVVGNNFIQQQLNNDG
jgi:hypothetical protein